MDKIFTFIGAIIIALGGASAIIIPLSSFIAKIWADIFMRKKTVEYDEKFEYYKNALEIERERYKSLNEQISHKNKAIFDLELEILNQIVPHAIKLRNLFHRYFTHINDSDDSAKMYDELINDLSCFNDIVIKNSIIVNDKVYNLLINYHTLMRDKIVRIQEFDTLKVDEQVEYYDEANGDVNNELYNLIAYIRNYLYKIASVD